MLPTYQNPIATNQLAQMLTQQMGAGLSQEEHTVKVNGRPGAEAYQLAPNSDKLLLDSSAPIVWLVQTDGAGYKTLTPYDMYEHDVCCPDDFDNGTGNFYVYEWYIPGTDEIFYVGKGTRSRYTVRKRNKLFMEYLKHFECKSRIIKRFETEEEAFDYERKRIIYLKSIDQAFCNVIPGGYGGKSSVWTEEERKFWGEHNIMKTELQRERMRNHNPMKNKAVAEKVVNKRMKDVIIGDTCYKGLKAAAKSQGISVEVMFNWVKRGYTRSFVKCYYKDEPKLVMEIKKPSGPKRPVILDGVLYESGKAAADSINGTNAGINYAIRHHTFYKGHTCKYAE